MISWRVTNPAPAWAVTAYPDLGRARPTPGAANHLKKLRMWRGDWNPRHSEAVSVILLEKRLTALVEGVMRDDHTIVQTDVRQPARLQEPAGQHAIAVSRPALSRRMVVHRN